MSVINQMLKDLEERRSLKQRLNTLSKVDLESIFSEGTHIPRRYFKIIFISSFVVLLGLGMYYKISKQPSHPIPAAIQPQVQIPQTPAPTPPVLKALLTGMELIKEPATRLILKFNQSVQYQVQEEPEQGMWQATFDNTEVSSTVTPLAVQNTPIKTLEMHPIADKLHIKLILLKPTRIQSMLLTHPNYTEFLMDFVEILPTAIEELVGETQPIPTPTPPPAPVLVKIKHESSKAERVETFLQESFVFIEKQQFEEAEQKLQEALTLLPNHTKARETDVKLKFQLGHFLEAEQSLARGLAASPQYLPFIQLKARLWVETGKPQEALSFLIKHQALGRSNPDYLSFMATLYQQEGKNAEAIMHYQQALRIQAHNWRSRMGLAIALETEGRLEEALGVYKTANAYPEADKASKEFMEKRILVLRKQ